MRITVGIGVGVVLAVHRNPLARLDARRQPEQASHRRRRRAAQRQRPMGERAVQVDSGEDK